MGEEESAEAIRTGLTIRQRAEPVRRIETAFLTVFSRCPVRGPKARGSGRNPRGTAGRSQDSRH